MITIEKLNLSELKELLSGLKKYQDMTKKLGKRGRDLFHSELASGAQYVVEYFPSVSEDALWEQAQNVYKKAFGETPKRQEVVFVKKESLG